MAEIIPFQRPLRPVLPTVVGNLDYDEFEALLRRVDGLLTSSGVERLFIDQSLIHTRLEKGDELTANGTDCAIKHAIRALRCTLLKTFLEEDYRGKTKGQVIS